MYQMHPTSKPQVATSPWVLSEGSRDLANPSGCRNLSCLGEASKAILREVAHSEAACGKASEAALSEVACGEVGKVASSGFVLELACGGEKA